MFLTSVGERQSKLPREGNVYLCYVSKTSAGSESYGIYGWAGGRIKKGSLVSCQLMLLAYVLLSGDVRLSVLSDNAAIAKVCTSKTYVQDAPVEPQEVSAVRAPSPW